jgi:hypothetical protein
LVLTFCGLLDEDRRAFDKRADSHKGVWIIAPLPQGVCPLFLSPASYPRGGVLQAVRNSWHRRSSVLRFGILAALLSVSPLSSAMALPILAVDAVYTQNFDGLPASGTATWLNDSTLAGWFHARTGSGTTILADNGGSSAGNLYSFGTGTSTDRALGSIGSGNASAGNMYWGILFSNDTGDTITALDIAYTGEQWRNGGVAAAQTVAFSYIVGNGLTGMLTDFTVGGVAVPALDFISPIFSATASAVDGNAAANQVALSFSISGLIIPAGSGVLLRWSDIDHPGSDHGLAIDNLSVTARAAATAPVPEPGTLVLLSIALSFIARHIRCRRQSRV